MKPPQSFTFWFPILNGKISLHCMFFIKRDPIAYSKEITSIDLTFFDFLCSAWVWVTNVLLPLVINSIFSMRQHTTPMAKKHRPKIVQWLWEKVLVVGIATSRIWLGIVEVVIAMQHLVHTNATGLNDTMLATSTHHQNDDVDNLISIVGPAIGICKCATCILA